MWHQGGVVCRVCASNAVVGPWAWEAGCQAWVDGIAEVAAQNCDHYLVVRRGVGRGACVCARACVAQCGVWLAGCVVCPFGPLIAWNRTNTCVPCHALSPLPPCMKSQKTQMTHLKDLFRGPTNAASANLTTHNPTTLNLREVPNVANLNLTLDPRPTTPPDTTNRRRRRRLPHRKGLILCAGWRHDCADPRANSPQQLCRRPCVTFSA